MCSSSGGGSGRSKNGMRSPYIRGNSLNRGLTAHEKWVPSADDDVVSDRRRSAPGPCPVELGRAHRYRVLPGYEEQSEARRATRILPPPVIPGPTWATGGREREGNPQLWVGPSCVPIGGSRSW